MSKNESVSGKVLKKIVAAVIAVAILGGIGFGVYKYASGKSASAEQTSAYREYTVTKGSITVGTSESGTVALDRSYVTLPVSAEIEEVYVKVGSTVSAGDKIAKMNVDDVDELKKQYQDKIDSAKLALDSAKIDADKKLAEAKQTYTASLQSGSSAEDTYKLSITKIENDISSAEKSMTSLKEQLAEAEEMKKTYPAAYAVLTDYEDTLEGYNEVYDGYSDTYEGYEKVLKDYQKQLAAIQTEYDNYMADIEETYTNIKTAKENYEKAEDELEAADKALDDANSAYSDALSASFFSSTTDTSSSGSSSESALTTAQKAQASATSAYQTAYENFNKARAAYTDMYKSLSITYSNTIDSYENKISAQNTKISDYQDMMDTFSDKMSDYNKMLTDYKTEYEDYKSDFTDSYNGLDAEGIDDKIDALTDSISEAEYNITKLNSDKNGDTLTAEQQLESAQYASSNAASIYAQTTEEINSSLKTKQDEYDSAVSDYDDFLEDLGDGVYAYAAASGAVAEVNVAAGDAYNENQALASIADASGLSVSVAVSEDDIATLTVGQACSVSLSAYENVTFDGVIDTIAVEPSRSSGSVSYAVSVSFEPKENVTVYSGMTADVTFLQKQVTDVLYVSIKAVSYKGDGISTVLVYDENGSVVEKDVKTGFSDGRYVEITDGLSAGDTVLAESAVSLE